jgi:hypothetical protein
MCYLSLEVFIIDCADFNLVETLFQSLKVINQRTYLLESNVIQLKDI